MRDMDSASNKLEELRRRLIARANGDIREARHRRIRDGSTKGMLSKEFMARVFWFEVTSKKTRQTTKRRTSLSLSSGQHLS